MMFSPPFLNLEQEQLVYDIAELPYCFLGGSRRMQQKYPGDIAVEETTDWDFYAKDSKQIRKTLIEKGFRDKRVDKEYRDMLCKAVFAHDALNIQVVLRKNVEIYREIFESLSPDIYIKRLWKSSEFKTDPDLDSFTEGERIKKYFDGLYKLHKQLFCRKRKKVL